MDFQPPLELTNWNFRRVVWVTLVLILIGLGFWLLIRFYQVIFIFFSAIIISTVIRPAVNWLSRRGISPLWGIILVFSFLFLLFIGFLMLFLPMIIEQGTTLFAAVPRYYQNFLEWMITNPNPMLKQLSETLPTTLPGLIPFQQSGQQMLDSVEQVIIYFTSAIEVIFLTAAIFLLIVHWTLDGSQTIQSLLQLAPKNKRENIQELVQAMETKVGFFVAGQGVLCLVIGFLSLIAYLIIGIPDPLVLALVAGILEAIPIIGPILGAVPAALIALSVDPSKLIWVIAASIIIQQLENSILVPRIMRKAVGVNPFVTLLAFFAFSSAFGIAGSLMAIPFAAIIQILLNRFVFYPTEAVPELSDNRDLASRLRYEAQDLASDLRKQARVNKAGSTATIRQIDHTMDEIEAITTDLDALLAQIHPQSSR